jgi:glycosyltransferase involved in cell wall biosynthesis
MNNLVIIPTYNEKENVAEMIRTVFTLQTPFQILIIEDGSPDGTAEIVKRLQTEYPDRLHMIERKGKLGLGTAYLTGFKWALEKGYDFIFEMDCDFSHPPKDLENLYRAWKHGFKLVEVPIIFTERQEGTSKMSGGIFNEALWGILKMKIRSWFKKYPGYSSQGRG